MTIRPDCSALTEVSVMTIRPDCSALTQVSVVTFALIAARLPVEEGTTRP
jgi:hypothetical protein